MKHLGYRYILISLVVAAVCAGIAYFMPKSLRAVSVAYFPMSQTQALSASALLGGSSGSRAGGTVIGLGGAIEYPLTGAGVDMALGIALSNTTLNRVIQVNHLEEKWHCSYLDAFKKVQGSLAVNVDKDTGFLDMTYEDRDPDLAVSVLNAVEAVVKAKSEDLTLDLSRRNRAFVQNLLSDAIAKRSVLEARWMNIVGKSGVSSTTALLTNYYLAAGKLGDVDAQLSSAHSKLEAYENTLSKLYSKSTPQELALGYSEVADTSGVLASLAKALQERRLKLADDMAKYQVSSPEVRLSRTALATAESLARKTLQDRLKGVKLSFQPALMEANSQYFALKSQANSYRELLKQLTEQLKRSSGSEVRTTLAKADFEAADALVRQLQKEVATALIAEQRDPARFELIDAPHVDLLYKSPRPTLVAVVSFFLALLIQLVPQIRKLVVLE